MCRFSVPSCLCDKVVVPFLVWEVARRRGCTFPRGIYNLFSGRWGAAESSSCVCFFSVAFSSKQSLCQSGIFGEYILISSESFPHFSLHFCACHSRLPIVITLVPQAVLNFELDIIVFDPKGERPVDVIKMNPG